MSVIRRKLVAVGDSACGKNCLLTVFSKGTFPAACTLYDGSVTDVEVDGKHVELALWKLNQEDYDRPICYPGSHVILICFAIDSPNSLDNAQEKWSPEVAHACVGVPTILVGCKKDLRHDPWVIKELRKTGQRPVTPEHAVAFAQKIGVKYYLECSAKTGEGVLEVLQCAAREALLGHENKKSTGKEKSESECLVL